MHQNLLRLLLLTSILLAGCASVPDSYEQTPSYTWQAPEQTTMGAFFQENAPADPDLSGHYLLSDPHEAFLARFGFAAQAEKTLDLQYYLWKGDVTGRLLLHQAFQAADRGVKVRILIDDIYHTKRDHNYKVIDSHPNVQVRVYNPVANRGMGRNFNYLFNKSQLNHRMHNKIFLVDNAIAIMGGRNIGDDYFGIDPNLNFEDMDVIAVGPAARDAGAAYDLYWNSPKAAPIGDINDEVITPADLKALRDTINTGLSGYIDAVPYSVPLDTAELAQILNEMLAEMQWGKTEVVVDTLDRFEGGNTSAFVELGERLAGQVQNEILIQTAYLIPTDEGIANIKELTDRGIRVRIMTNSMMSNNHLSVHAHYMKYRKPLIEAGAELYELRPDSALLEYYKEQDGDISDSHAGLHTKAFVVDDNISMIGSYNMDPRSRIWNSEIGLLIESKEFAAKVLIDMNEELEPGNSYRVTLDDKGKLLWTIESENGVETWSHDPGASVWRRMGARFISWIPIENEL